MNSSAPIITTSLPGRIVVGEQYDYFVVPEHVAMTPENIEKYCKGLLLDWDAKKFHIPAEWLEEEERCGVRWRRADVVPLNKWCSVVSVIHNLLQTGWTGNAEYHTPIPGWGERLRFWIAPPPAAVS